MSAAEAEAAVLGAVMLSNAAFDVAEVSELQPEHFGNARHRVVWEAIRTLLRNGDPVDVVTLEHRLDLEGHLALVGGLEGLMAICDPHATTHNVGVHARIVRDAARARFAVRVLRESADAVGQVDPGDAVDAILEASARLASLAADGGDGLMSLGEVVRAALEQARARAAGTVSPCAWGLETLDARFDGGLMPGELVIIAGRPGMGKTVLGLNLMSAAAHRGEACLRFDLEMLPEQLGRRAIATGGMVANKDTKKPGSERVWQVMQAAVDHFRELPGRVFFGRATLDKVLSVSRAWARSTRRRGPIIVDYLQLLELGGADRRLPREQQIAKITRELKLLAKELGVPVVLLCQLNRDVEKREEKRPRLSDLRESGSIEQDADSVVLLYRPAMYSDADPFDAEAIVAKCREGVPGTCALRFEGHFSRFLDRSQG